MPEPARPTVFLSHASEDKERFVLSFAERLRTNGVDVWLDKWEMLPGDSLVAKIFVEGLDQAEAVLLVISRHSLTKPWVAEELDAAVVKRISDGTRLIPIVLDDLGPSDVPAAIRHLLYESVGDLTDLDDVVDRVVRSIHGVVDRPSLGQAPNYTKSAAARIRGLDRIDSLILKSAGAEAVRDYGTRFTTVEFLDSITTELALTEEQAVESLHVLNDMHHIKISQRLGSGIPAMPRFELTDSGLETYLRSYEPDFATIEETVIARLAAWPDEQGTELDLIKQVDAPRLIVRHVLEQCGHRGLLTARRVSGPVAVRFHNLSPRLRRLATS